MPDSKYTSILVLLVLSTPFHAYNFDVSEKICAVRNLKLNQKLRGSFRVLNNPRDEVEVTAYTHLNEHLFGQRYIESGSFEFMANQEGMFKICFRSWEKKQMTVALKLNVKKDKHFEMPKEG